jgi:alpha-tubulin suppressor-like RCC1 family protein
MVSKKQFPGRAAAAAAMASMIWFAGCGGGGEAPPQSGSPTSSGVSSVSVTPATVDEFWGWDVQLTPLAFDVAGAPVTPAPTYVWSSTDASTASVDITGRATLLRPGMATLSATTGSLSGQAVVNVRGFERLARATGRTMCALADGRERIYCWGAASSSGAWLIAATPQEYDFVVPTPILRGQIPQGSTIRKVVVGTFHACALTDSGEAYCWGSNNNRGALGIDVMDGGRDAPTRIAAGEIPTGVRAVDIAISAGGGCIVADDGRLYCWGGFDNTLPNPAVDVNRPVAAPVAAVAGDVAAGVNLVRVEKDINKACALGDNGRAYCWGAGARTPALVPAGAVPAGTRLVDLQMGSDVPCALADDGNIYCWGSADGSRFGDGTSGPASAREPSRVSTGTKPATTRFVGLTVGGISISSCATADDGKAYCWSRSYQGSGADGNEADHLVPTPTTVLDGEKDAAFRWLAVNCATYTCTGLASDRRIYNWGSNEHRMLSRPDSAANIRSAMPLMVTRPSRD